VRLPRSGVRSPRSLKSDSNATRGTNTSRSFKVAEIGPLRAMAGPPGGSKRDGDRQTALPATLMRSRRKHPRPRPPIRPTHELRSQPQAFGEPRAFPPSRRRHRDRSDSPRSIVAAAPLAKRALEPVETAPRRVDAVEARCSLVVSVLRAPKGPPRGSRRVGREAVADAALKPVVSPPRPLSPGRPSPHGGGPVVERPGRAPFAARAYISIAATPR
jgi:hypothetical protein